MMRRALLLVLAAAALPFPAAALPATAADVDPLVAALQLTMDEILIRRTEVYACGGDEAAPVVARLDAAEAEAALLQIRLSDPAAFEVASLPPLAEHAVATKRELDDVVDGYLSTCP